MKDRVVCIEEFEGISNNGNRYNDNPLKGEIYTIEKIWYHGIKTYFELVEFPPIPKKRAYLNTHFRPVDESFGEWVEETIMKDAELEKLIR